MAASEGLCDICVTQDITLVATDWCAECEQSLCESCKSHHSAATFSRTHQTIPFERFHQLPSFVKDIKNCCDEHEAKFEYFCSKHELPCCVECVKSTHFECRNLTPLHKVVLQYRDSTALTDFKCTLSELQGNLHAIVENRKGNLSSLVFQKNDCIKKIEEAKNNAVHVLDKIEAELKREVENSHTKAETVIQVLLKELHKSKMKVENMQKEFEIVKTYASDFQFFMSIRHLGNSAKDIETNLHTVLLEDSAVDNITLSFGSAENRTFENALPFLGKVEILHENCQVKLLNQRDKQAQLLTVGTCDIDGLQLHPLLENIKVRNPRRRFAQEVLILDNCFLMTVWFFLTN